MAAIAEETLYFMAITNSCVDEGGCTRMVFAQFTGNENAFDEFYRIWKDYSPDGKSFGKGGMTETILPASFDRKYLLTESQVRAMTQVLSIGATDSDGVPIYPFSILRGKYTLNRQILSDFIDGFDDNGDDDGDYDFECYDRLCGDWDNPIGEEGFENEEEFEDEEE